MVNSRTYIYLWLHILLHVFLQYALQSSSLQPVHSQPRTCGIGTSARSAACKKLSMVAYSSSTFAFHEVTTETEKVLVCVCCSNASVWFGSKFIYLLATFLPSLTIQHCHVPQFVLNAQNLSEMADGLLFMAGVDVHPELGLQPHHLCKIVGTPKHLVHIMWDLKALPQHSVCKDPAKKRQ